MFDYIKGSLEDKRCTEKGCYITIDNNGIGYKFEICSSDFNNLPEKNSEIKIYSALIHKEDIMFLCGFLNRETRDIFSILTSVSGVGTKMGLTLLGEFDLYELISLVQTQNYKELTRAKGVGPKLAQKIILELKDKLMKVSVPTELSKTTQIPEEFNEVISILQSLGYEDKEIKDAFSKCNIDRNATQEEILRATLTILSM